MLHPLGFVEGKFKKFINSDFGPEGCAVIVTNFMKLKIKIILKEVIHFRY